MEIFHGRASRPRLLGYLSNWTDMQQDEATKKRARDYLLRMALLKGGQMRYLEVDLKLEKLREDVEEGVYPGKELKVSTVSTKAANPSSHQSHDIIDR
ncbi:hypothetical protein FRC17_000639 [Serendipita sp. 399]|nr:hypothetical protein FRC17_000639 [Serendipita sp. 399]